MIAKKMASADAAIKKARRAGHSCRWKKDLRRRNNWELLLSSVLLIMSAILVSSRRAEMGTPRAAPPPSIPYGCLRLRRRLGFLKHRNFFHRFRDLLPQTRAPNISCE